MKHNAHFKAKALFCKNNNYVVSVQLRHLERKENIPTYSKFVKRRSNDTFSPVDQHNFLWISNRKNSRLTVIRII